MEEAKEMIKDTGESVMVAISSEKANSIFEEAYKRGIPHNALFFMSQFVFLVELF